MNEKPVELEKELINEPQIDVAREALLYGMNPDEYYTREEIDEYFYDKVDIDNNFYDKEEVETLVDGSKEIIHILSSNEGFQIFLDKYKQNKDILIKISDIEELFFVNYDSGNTIRLKSIDSKTISRWNNNSGTDSIIYEYKQYTINYKKDEEGNFILVSYVNNGEVTQGEAFLTTSSYASTNDKYFVPTQKHNPVSKGHLDDIITQTKEELAQPIYINASPSTDSTMQSNYIPRAIKLMIDRKKVFIIYSPWNISNKRNLLYIDINENSKSYYVYSCTSNTTQKITTDSYGNIVNILDRYIGFFGNYTVDGNGNVTVTSFYKQDTLVNSENSTDLVSKTYVDNAISNAITTTLGGSY